MFLCCPSFFLPADPQAEEPEPLEVAADIGRAAVGEAVKIATAEGQDLAVGNAQDSLAVVEHSSEDALEEEVVVEVKVPLQTITHFPPL